MTPLIQMKNICKSYGNKAALVDVNFSVFPGEIHILAGESDSGKTTLMKILAGVEPSYEGHIEIEGKLAHPTSPLNANHLGIAMIHNKVSLVPSMTVVDNIFLSHFHTRFGFMKDRAQKIEAQKILERLDLSIDVEQPVDGLSIATQRFIEIAKAIDIQAKVIILDEVSGALNASELKKLFQILQELKSQGCGIVFITHKMDEVRALADNITVLRKGHAIGTAPFSELPTQVGYITKDQELREHEMALFPKAPHSDTLELGGFQNDLYQHKEQMVALEEVMHEVLSVFSSPKSPLASKAQEPLPALDAEPPPSAEDTYRKMIVDVMCLSIDYWETSTNSGKSALAEKSQIWSLYNDNGTYRTRTLDRYLNLNTLPKKPRVQDVFRTANYVLENCLPLKSKKSVLKKKLTHLQEIQRSSRNRKGNTLS